MRNPVPFLMRSTPREATVSAERSDALAVAISPRNPVVCTASAAAPGHAPTHQHGRGCGHMAVVHGKHLDYLVAGRLHHPHGDHCDNHGPVKTVS